MTLPIWKRQALYVLWYEQSMYDAWCGRGSETTRVYHLGQCKELVALVQQYSWPTWKDKSFSQFYATMQTMLKELATMIVRSKDALSYYNYVQRGNLRCACHYDTEQKITSIEFSVVPTQTLNWYWKKNICSINNLEKDSRRALHSRLSQLAND